MRPKSRDDAADAIGTGRRIPCGELEAVAPVLEFNPEQPSLSKVTLVLLWKGLCLLSFDRHVYSRVNNLSVDTRGSRSRQNFEGEDRL